jgi:hypothetical protein
MLHDHLETPSSVDAKTAEETLALALRLQQERGERVSLEELQRTADEAGIDRVYLEGALKQVTQKAQDEQLAAQDNLIHNRRLIVMGAAFATAVIVALFVTHSGGRFPGGLMAFVFVPVFARRLLFRDVRSGRRR